VIRKPERGLVHVQDVRLIAVRAGKTRTIRGHEIGFLLVGLLGRLCCLICLQTIDEQVALNRITTVGACMRHPFFELLKKIVFLPIFGRSKI
jgi:hypothetical protein